MNEQCVSGYTIAGEAVTIRVPDNDFHYRSAIIPAVWDEALSKAAFYVIL
jgi:hypothetical protein